MKKPLLDLRIGETTVVYANALLDAKLKEITEDARGSMVKYFTEELIEIANKTVHTIKTEKIKNTMQWSRKPNFSMELVDGGGISGSSHIDPDKACLKSNHKELAEKTATKQTETILKDFFNKSHSKLDPIIEKSGAPNSIKVTSHGFSRGAFEADMSFAWEDGRSFKVRTKIVSVGYTDRLGWFAKYPTTFHAVVLKDGSQMKQPSEAKILLHF